MSRKVNIFNSLSAFSCADADVNAFFALSDFSEANLSSWLSTIGKTYNEVYNATCAFVTAIKTAGISGTNSAMYLPIGNDSTRRKYNFWNPLDSDAAFRLTFNGGISFTNFAIKGNGVNGYSDTHWIPSSYGSASAMSFAIDSADNIAGSTQVMGVFNNPNRRMFVILGAATPSIQIADAGITTYTGTRKGLFICRRAAASGAGAMEAYRDGVSLGTQTSSYTPNFYSFYLNAAHNYNGLPNFYAQHGVNFAILSPQGWSDAQALALNSAYSTFKTALGIP